MSFFTRLAALSNLVLLVSCSQMPAQDQSRTDGHYENSSKKESEAYIGKQMVVPEYEPARSVVVGLPIVSEFGMEGLVDEIIKAGAETVYMTVESNKKGITTNSKTLRGLKQLLGQDIDKVKLVPQKYQGSVTVWARDWAPLGARTNGDDAFSKPVLLDFNYYSSRPSDDSTSYSVANAFDFDRVSVPVYNEGGNFMINSDGFCMMSTRVSQANAYKEVKGDMILNEEEIAQYYQDYAGCKDVMIFPRLPHEGTGHIDMWVKFLDNETVIVGDISGKALDLARKYDPDSYKVSSDMSEYLAERVEELQDLGFKVKRIPMPLADYYVARSYTNSLLLNGVALVPKYEMGVNEDYTNYTYTDDNLLSSYEQEVRKVYEESGFEVVFVNSDELISMGGAIHCVTMQLP